MPTNSHSVYHIEALIDRGKQSTFPQFFIVSNVCVFFFNVDFEEDSLPSFIIPDITPKFHY